jgi:hypothetical protein
MIWEHDEDRLALLELLRTGVLRRRSAQAQAWAHLEALPWVRRSGRRGELALVDEHRAAVAGLLDHVWRDWKRWDGELERAGLPRTPKGWRALLDEQKAAGLGPLPDRLNLRTATSAVAPHSKSTLGAKRRDALGDIEITRDGVVRLRAPTGVAVVRGSRRVDAGTLAELLGEVTISDRALRDGTVLEGPIRAVLLVENLGPYQDLDPPAGWLVVHVPGWNTAAVRLFLGGLPHLPVIHFGDLDPAGVRIHEHLRSIHPAVRWAVPEFWSERIDTHALRGVWPEDLDLSASPSLCRELAARGLWLEQECIALDPRLAPALERLADD